MPPIRKEVVIGECRVLLGDCLEILPTLGKVDAVVTDPPYGMSYKSGYATEALWQGDGIEGDESTFVRDYVVHYARKVPMLCFGTWRVERPKRTKIVLIWDKGGALGMGDLRIPWKCDHEEIYVLGGGFVGTRDSGSVLRFPPVQSTAKNGRQHPNEKPVGLLQDLVRKTPGVVLDPFMGSGTTGVACVKLGRKFVGIELHEPYFDIACDRIAKAYAQPDMFVERAPEPVQQPLFSPEAA